MTKFLAAASLGTDSHSVVIEEQDGSKKKTIKARHILIATGGYPIFPTGEGVKENTILSDGFFELEEQLRKAVVVGAGYIAVELLSGSSPSFGHGHKTCRIKRIGLEELRQNDPNHIR